jgi:hypothetical protein
LIMIATATLFCLIMIVTATLLAWWWLPQLHFFFDNDCYSYMFWQSLLQLHFFDYDCYRYILASWWLPQLHFFVWQWLLQLHFLFVLSVSECGLLHIWGYLSICSQYMDHICCSIMGRFTWRCSIC